MSIAGANEVDCAYFVMNVSGIRNEAKLTLILLYPCTHANLAQIDCPSGSFSSNDFYLKIIKGFHNKNNFPATVSVLLTLNLLQNFHEFLGTVPLKHDALKRP